jgi:hypothetical protein
MAGSFSDYLELKILEEVVGKTAYVMPTVYAALCTADPTDAGVGSSMGECLALGSDYARVATAGSDWSTAAAGAIENTTAITFPAATQAWGHVTHFALVDASASGNMLMHGELTVHKDVTSGDTVSFAAGALDITLG